MVGVRRALAWGDLRHLEGLRRPLSIDRVGGSRIDAALVAV